MTDILTPEQRSELMSRVRSKDTKPEMTVRRLIHGMGYRYRLHRKDLPGKPDLVFPGRKAVIFVHGCFWHGHEGCKLARIPKSRVDFWKRKVSENRQRDERNIQALQSTGWRVLVIWECQLRDLDTLKKIIKEFLDKKGEA